MSASASALTRWAAPLSLIAAGAGMSAFVASCGAGPFSTELLAGLPLIALLTLVVVRTAAGPAGRMGDLVVTLLVAFIVGLHVLLLAVKLGLTDRFDVGVPVATAALFVALGPAIATLERGSPMGLRTPATLASAALWTRTHRRLGLAFGAAGVAGGAALVLAEPWIAVTVMGGLPVVAMAALAGAASREHRASAARHSEERAQGSVDDRSQLR